MTWSLPASAPSTRWSLCAPVGGQMQWSRLRGVTRGDFGWLQSSGGRKKIGFPWELDLEKDDLIWLKKVHLIEDFPGLRGYDCLVYPWLYSKILCRGTKLNLIFLEVVHEEKVRFALRWLPCTQSNSATVQSFTITHSCQFGNCIYWSLLPENSICLRWMEAVVLP